MDDHEKGVLEATPEVATIYRGYDHRNRMGYSWTFSPNKARWFANRYMPGRNPKLVKGQIERNKIIAFFSPKGENEVAVHPGGIKFGTVPTGSGERLMR